MASYGDCMAFFNVTLTDETTEQIPGADAYQQEGPLTTFFAVASDRQVIDSWSTRLASFRTADIVKVRRDAASGEGREPLLRSA